MVFLPAASAAGQNVLLLPGGNSRETYFTVHELHAAHRISRGAGVKVGVLDHLFGFDDHADLYAGGANFVAGGDVPFRAVSEHGYWMALVLREIAPEAEIYALNTSSRDEAEKAAAMVRAIDWAVEHGLHVLTYSDRAFSAADRELLDAAMARAHRAGIVTTFIHSPQPENLLPGWIGPRSGDDGREPDLNILHFNYGRIFVDKQLRWQNGETRQISDHPFLSKSSTSPVAAGLVALLLSMEPGLDPVSVKRILMTTSRPYTIDGMTGERVPDAYAALLSRRREEP
jgi:hypothetical protein